MTRVRIVPFVLFAIACGVAALLVVPHGLQAESMLAAQDDPAEIADHALAGSLDASVTAREIEAALAAHDADLAKSFLDLARERGIQPAPPLAQKVADAVAEAASTSHAAESFARGLVTGEPDDVVGLAGTTLGDLFVFGDLRDAVREGARLASGEEADQMVLGLACVGLAITAGTYATFGAATPARVGVSVIKAARKTGRLGARMGEWIGRSLREAIDWTTLKRAIAGASLTQPLVAVRAAREAVKVEKAGGLMQLIRNVGKVQTKAGTQAALDGLKLAENPAEIARVAQLAEKKGSKTRAILKVLGRGAIALTLGAFNLSLWVFAALLTLFGFVSSAKSAAERATLRHLHRRKALKLQREQERMIAAALSRI
ncbi:MAG: hypothetical protein QOF19_2076 [Alphaproteobacteria bacterium]|jgi:hypothetical protein|nr:hypothetical protein [Alphaproteobacteria bacterium]